MKRVWVVLWTLLMSVCGTPQADTITYALDDPVNSMTGTIGTLALFDSRAGDLLAASLEVSGWSEFSFSGVNDTQPSKVASLTAQSNFQFFSSLGATRLDSLYFFLQETTGSRTFPPGGFVFFGPTSKSDQFIIDMSPNLPLLKAPTGGNFQIGCNVLQGLGVGFGSGDIDTTNFSKSGCGFSITYVYAPVPEPGITVLLVVGIGFVLLASDGNRQRSGTRS